MKVWKKESGFTLIELVIVIVILGILAAIAIPKFVDLSSSSEAAAAAAMQGNVKSAYAITIAEHAANPALAQYPTVTELAANVDGGIALGGGIQTTINGTSYTVRTYQDTAGTTQTTSINQTVGSVGDIYAS